MIYIFFPLIGFIVGSIGTLVGAGGGFILMPVLLLLFRDMPVEKATMISMTVIFFNSLSGTIAYAYMKRIDFKTGILFAAATIPGSVIGTLLTAFIKRESFNIIFGVFLILASFMLCFLRKSKNKFPENRKTFCIDCEINDKYGNVFSYSYNIAIGLILSLFTGFISPLMGIGGGIIHVPAMIRILSFPPHIATATSHFTLMIMSFVSVLVHLLSYFDSKTLFYAALLSAGAFPGAQVGALLSRRTNEKYIIAILSLALLIAGIRIIFLKR